MRSDDSIRPSVARVKRQSTGKRLRFEVFKRDGFTCRYCGAQPPEVVLVVDHVVPVSGGGSTTLENLVTACEPCNQGKAHRPLEDAQPRVDADVLYLETQQEIAELRRYQEALALREQAIGSVIATLQELWMNVGELDWWPKDRVLRGLLLNYDPEIVEEAVLDVATKIGTGYLKRNANWMAYLWAVARNIAKDRDGVEAEQ